MKKEDIVEGNIYKLLISIDGNREGTEVVFKGWTKDGKWGVCNPVGEPDMQSSFVVSPEDIEEINITYQLILSEKQANILIEALDVYSRIGMGQLNIVAESITKQYDSNHHYRYSSDVMEIVKSCMNTAKLALGHPINGNLSIAGSDTPKSAQIAYDVQCVLRKSVKASYGIWNNDPLHVDKNTPLAEVKVVCK